MRALIAREKGDKDPWDLKLVSGGLLDIEFIAQFLVLAFAHERPGIRDVSTRAVIAKAGAEGLLKPEQAEALSHAHRLFTDATQIMRLGGRRAVRSGQSSRWRQAPHRRRRRRCPILKRLTGDIAEARGKVREVFQEILGGAKKR